MRAGHRYKTGASFDQVLMLYRFEKTVRFDFQRNRKNRKRCTQCVETNTSFRSTQTSTAI